MDQKLIKGFSVDELKKRGLSAQDSELYSRYMVIPIDEIKKAPWNYKGEDAHTSEKLNENLKRNGQIENVIVRQLPDGTYEMGNGNHRLDELRKLGKSHVMAYNCGDISESEMKRIAIETNETSFDADRQKLSVLIADLSIEFDEIELTFPFTDVEMESYLMIANATESDGSQEVPDLPTETPLRDDSVTTDRMEELTILGGYNTAISRSKPSKTIQYYEKNQLLKGDVLDYGCGHEVHNYHKFDPSCAANYELLRRKYDTIICNYVLNILPLPHNRFELVLAVMNLLKGYGVAYFAVKDRKKGQDSETEQGSFECGWDVDDWDEFFKRFEGEKIKANFPCWKITKPVETVNF